MMDNTEPSHPPYSESDEDFEEAEDSDQGVAPPLIRYRPASTDGPSTHHGPRRVSNRVTSPSLRGSLPALRRGEPEPSTARYLSATTSVAEPQFVDTPARQASGGGVLMNFQTNNYSNLTNPTICHTTSDIYQSLNDTEAAVTYLHKYVAPGALHNSNERPAVPGCQEHTRKDILNFLHRWALDGSSNNRVLWLNGPAGIGKSAIVQDFAAECQRKRQLGASFFFKRHDPIRGTWKRLFPTLAFQLASFPVLKHVITEAVNNNRLVAEQAMELQVETIFIGPLRMYQPPENEPPLLIVVDGLDECEDFKVEDKVLRLLLGCIRDHKLSIRLLIASRPEPNIQAIFHQTQRQLWTECVVPPDHNGVRKYLTAELGRLLQPQYLNPRSSVAEPERWPTEEQINKLVARSSGAYIYASVVVRHIEYGGHRPQRPHEYSSHRRPCLKEVMDVNPRSIAPLDALYARIVSSSADRSSFDKFVDILKAAATIGIHPEDIDELLELEPYTAREALSGMHSLLIIPEERMVGLRGPTDFYHTSFIDYLEDPDRSGEFCTLSHTRNSIFINASIKRLSQPQTLDRQADTFLKIILNSLLKTLELHPQDPRVLDGLSKEEFQRCFTLGYPSNEQLAGVGQWIKKHPDTPQRKKVINDIHDFLYIRDLEGALWTPTHRSKKIAPHTRLRQRLIPLYEEILQNPKVLQFLRALSVWSGASFGPRPDIILPQFSVLTLEHLRLTWIDIRPLARLKDVVDTPVSFRRGESPLDFLAARSYGFEGGGKRLSRKIVEEKSCRDLISYIKTLLENHRRPLFALGSDWVDIFLDLYTEPEAVLFEVASIDFSQFCKYAEEAPHYHRNDHIEFEFHEQLDRLLERIEEYDFFRHTPLRESWYAQRQAIDECFATCERILGSGSEGDYNMGEQMLVD
ncbi:hypothetical protein B0H11DRAFT_279706 [Mycena galericulata]|nr:hypothetical protein B0H11DRAFT_279706 [Mycena galericulata]